MNKLFTIALLLLVLAGCDTGSHSSSSEAVAVDGSTTFSSSSQITAQAFSVVEVGQNVTVEVNASNLPLTEGGGVNVTYDPTVLQARTITLNDKEWDYKNSRGSVDAKNGKINDIMVSSYQGVEGSASIVTIEFYTKQSGNTEISISESEKNPFSSNGSAIQPSFTGTQVQVN